MNHTIAKNIIGTVNDSKVFYMTTKEVEGHKVELYNYMFANYTHFLQHDAFELRGYTTIYNTDETHFANYLGLHKFFNLGQYPAVSYDVLKNEKIKSIYTKEDGSLITFIKLPNGKIVPKTKMDFDNQQLELVKSYCTKNPSFLDYISTNLENGIQLFFELVSPFNKVVLQYASTDLVLLRARVIETGAYIAIDDLEVPSFVSKVKQCDSYTLDELLVMAERLTGIEGWIVEFWNGTFVKIKTKWYFEMHQLITEQLNEKFIVKYIIENTIDDVLPKLDAEARAFVDSYMTAFFSKVAAIEKEVDKLLAIYDSIGLADFGRYHSKDTYFSIAINVIRKKMTKLDSIFAWIMDRNGLQFAKDFVS